MSSAAYLLHHASVTMGFPDSHLFHLGALDVGIPIQAFGVIVATGVLIGAALLRRYAEWHGVADEHIRALTGWVAISGFLGAHLFDCLFYNWSDVALHPLLLIEVWKGIASFGGFLGGAAGFAFYVWWKRLPPRLFADITIVGLLPAFTIGRIGCSTVSDHVGAHVDPSKWYAFLAVDYKRTVGNLNIHYPMLQGPTIRAWNLGLIEFMYLVPVCTLILYLAFRPSKRLKAGVITVLTALLYSPVRFLLDFLRPSDTDPRHAGLTFAQWLAIAAFAASAYLITVFLKGEAAVPVTRTSGEAQKKLKQLMLKDGAGADADK